MLNLAQPTKQAYQVKNPLSLEIHLASKKAKKKINRPRNEVAYNGPDSAKTTHKPGSRSVTYMSLKQLKQQKQTQLSNTSTFSRS